MVRSELNHTQENKEKNEAALVFLSLQFFFRALLSERLKQASFPVAYDQNPGHFVLYCTILRVVWVLTGVLCFYRLQFSRPSCHFLHAPVITFI